MEVAVLAVGVFDVVVAVADRGRRQHGDRIAPHQTHQLAAAARELVSGHEARARQCSGAALGPGDGAAGVRQLFEQQLHADPHELDQLRVGALVRFLALPLVDPGAA